jgi:hypothetical protein
MKARSLIKASLMFNVHLSRGSVAHSIPFISLGLWTMTNQHLPSMPPTVSVVLFSLFIATVAAIPAMITIRVRTSPVIVDHHTLQAFYLHNPSEWEVT